MYHLTCLCGADLVSATPEARCGNCGRHIRVEWQAEYIPKPPERTLTDLAERQQAQALPAKAAGGAGR